MELVALMMAAFHLGGPVPGYGIVHVHSLK